MRNRWWQVGLVLGLAFFMISDSDRGRFSFGADGKKSSSKKSSKKKKNPDAPPINLPSDPNEVVLSYDPGIGGGQPARKGEAPMLKIQADGAVSITHPATGAQASGKLKEDDLNDLMDFVVNEQDFLNLTTMMIDEEINKLSKAAGAFTDVKGIGTSVITVKTADKQNSLSYRAALIYAKKLPKAKEITRFAATEKRLSDLAVKIANSKQK